MRRLVAALVAALALLGACSSGDDDGRTGMTGGTSSEEEAAVRSAFEAYQDAILAKDGARAVSLIDESVLPSFERYRDLALHAPEAELRRERLVDQLAVLTMRGKVDGATLRSADVRTLVARAVELGLTGEAGVTGLSVDEVRVTGRTATAAVVRDGSPTPMRFLFRRAGDAWRIDLQPLLDGAEAALRAQAGTAGGPEAFVDNVLATLLGQAAAEQAWQPLGD